MDDFDGRGSDTAVVSSRGVRHQRTTYRQLALLSRRFASELQSRQIQKGERVLFWGENSGSWMAAFFGCVLNGTLAVPVDAASPLSFVQTIIADVRPSLILHDHPGPAPLDPSVPELSLQNWPDTVTGSTLLTIPERNENDPLQIIFTSGTTGHPKGVVHTHKNVLASIRPIEGEIAKYIKYERPFHPVRILHTLPLSHVFGQFMALWVPPLLGAEIHFESRLVASELIGYIQSRRISVLAAVPRILDLLQRHLEQQFPDLSERLAAGTRWKALARWWHFRDVHRAFGFKFWAFVCGGASLPAASERFWNGLGFVLIQGYGMTETTALVSLNHPFKLARGSVGQILPGREVRLTEDGEVLVRGETISNVVWQDGRFQQAESDWLATGDLANQDAAGNLHFRGRKKEVIVTSAGLNIHPEDLEAALLHQPGVVACSVVESQTAAGPEPLAVLIVHPGSDPAAAVDAANNQLAAFQRIQHWIEWPEADLPRTSTGKVLRREILRRLSAGEVASTNGDMVIQPALDLDSLGRVQLQAELEQRYGVALDDAALQQISTPDDLARVVRSAGTVRPSTSKLPEQIYPHWPWSRPVQWVRSAFLELVAMPLLRFLAKPQIRWTAKSLPRTPVLIVANHVTSYDVPFLLYALPGHLRRRVAVAMSGEMILDWRLARRQGHWFLNWIAPLQYRVVTALFNIFPLPQLGGFRRSFRHAGEAIDAGYSVIVFPEGRRSDDGSLQAFKKGSGLLWKELGVPALPLYIDGLGRLKVDRSRWFRSGQITVIVGCVLSPSPHSPEVLTEELQTAVAALKLQSGYFSVKSGKFTELD